MHEISATGEVVDFNTECDRLPTKSEYDAIVKKLDVAQPQEKKTRMQFNEPANGWQRALMELIGAQGFRDVESVATGTTEDVLIASPIAFRERVHLQVCIQVGDVALGMWLLVR